MKKYEFLEHMADVKMRVFGQDPEDLFKNAVEGMAKIQKESKVKNQKLEIRKPIKIKSMDTETLLVDFLSAILTQSDIENAVFPKAEIKKLSENAIEAEILGSKVDKFDEDIKAVTYHGIEVKKREEKTFEATVLFDV